MEVDILNDILGRIKHSDDVRKQCELLNSPIDVGRENRRFRIGARCCIVLHGISRDARR